MPGVRRHSAQRASLRGIHPSPTENDIIMVTLYKKATNEQHSAWHVSLVKVEERTKAPVKIGQPVKMDGSSVPVLDPIEEALALRAVDGLHIYKPQHMLCADYTKHRQLLSCMNTRVLLCWYMNKAPRGCRFATEPLLRQVRTRVKRRQQQIFENWTATEHPHRMTYLLLLEGCMWAVLSDVVGGNTAKLTRLLFIHTCIRTDYSDRIGWSVIWQTSIVWLRFIDVIILRTRIEPLKLINLFNSIQFF